MGSMERFKVCLVVSTFVTLTSTVCPMRKPSAFKLLINLSAICEMCTTPSMLGHSGFGEDTSTNMPNVLMSRMVPLNHCLSSTPIKPETSLIPLFLPPELLRTLLSTKEISNFRLPSIPPIFDIQTVTSSPVFTTPRMSGTHPAEAKCLGTKPSISVFTSTKMANSRTVVTLPFNSWPITSESKGIRLSANSCSVVFVRRTRSSMEMCCSITSSSSYCAVHILPPGSTHKTLVDHHLPSLSISTFMPGRNHVTKSFRTLEAMSTSDSTPLPSLRRTSQVVPSSLTSSTMAICHTPKMSTSTRSPASTCTNSTFSSFGGGPFLRPRAPLVGSGAVAACTREATSLPFCA
mmetsp:Transcript_4014/g.10056  ORF Transcript_4014/g.10056 Transcript_4014/m.10056 type:complete len:348 (-) Transcript_4014:661-1704(-)